MVDDDVSLQAWDVSESTKRRNPGIWKTPDAKLYEVGQPADPARRRLRQSARPVLNKLEMQWLQHLKHHYPSEEFRWQDRRYKLGNGVWYCPDITCARHKWRESGLVMETCWECKCFKGKNVDRGIVKLKVAAHEWPDVRWVLVSRDPATGGWNEEQVLP